MARVDNILATVPGQYIGEASLTLPLPETATVDEMAVEVEAAWVGKVRITYRRWKYRHQRTTRWAWSAVSAERVPLPG
jgi:hypothetical protein